MRRLAALAFVLVALGWGVWANRTEDRAVEGEQRITLQTPSPLRSPQKIQATGAPASGVSHTTAPALELLAGAPARQALYDAEAKPGEFVTPPSVSVAH